MGVRARKPQATGNLKNLCPVSPGLSCFTRKACSAHQCNDVAAAGPRRCLASIDSEFSGEGVGGFHSFVNCCYVIQLAADQQLPFPKPEALSFPLAAVDIEAGLMRSILHSRFCFLLFRVSSLGFRDWGLASGSKRSAVKPGACMLTGHSSAVTEGRRQAFALRGNPPKILSSLEVSTIRSNISTQSQIGPKYFYIFGKHPAAL